MNNGKKALWGVLIAVVALGMLAFPPAGLAHDRVRVGIGFGWGPPVWGYPGPYYRPYPRYYPYGYYYGPPPVVVEPAPPPCRQVWVEGRWEQVARDEGGGFTTYHPRWVPGHWEQYCP